MASFQTSSNDSRRARVTMEVKRLVETGKLTAANGEAAVTELLSIENDELLGKEIDTLSKGLSVVKLSSMAGNLCGAKRQLIGAVNDTSDAGKRSEQRTAVISAEMGRLPSTLPESERYTEAFNRAARNNPELFRS